MTYSNLSVRVAESVKDDFNDLCERIGMNPSTAVNLFIRCMLRERKVPFELKDNDPFYSKTTQSRIDSAIKQLKAGKGKEHELFESDEEDSY